MGSGPKEMHEVEQRRKQAVALRLAGVDLETIKDQVNKVTPETYRYSSADHVSMDLKRARDRSRARLDESVEDLRELQLDRYERLLAAAWPAALKGSEKAIAAACNLIIQICKLKRLEPPTQVELTHRIEMESTAVAEAVLAGIEALGLAPDARMVAMNAAQNRLLMIAAAPEETVG